MPQGGVYWLINAQAGRHEAFRRRRCTAFVRSAVPTTHLQECRRDARRHTTLAACLCKWLAQPTDLRRRRAQLEYALAPASCSRWRRCATPAQDEGPRSVKASEP
eukprot:2375942-Prymnesium_polylepis.1